MQLNYLKWVGLAVIAYLLIAVPGHGQVHPQYRAAQPAQTGQAVSRIVPEKTAIAPGETIWFAFAQELSPHWHVYWKNPGDSGLPLSLNWTLPDGWTASEILYPTPGRIPVGPLVNFGYEGAPKFLVSLTAPRSATPGTLAEISLNAGWLICEDVCIPEDASFSLSLPVDNSAIGADGAQADLFAAARSALPAPWPGGDIVFGKSGERLVIEIAMPGGFSDDLLNGQEPGEPGVFFFAEGEGYVSSAGEQFAATRGEKLFLNLKPDFQFASDDPGELRGVLKNLAQDGQAAYNIAARRDDNHIAALGNDLFAGIAEADNAGGETEVSDSDLFTADLEAPSQDTANIPILLLMAFAGGILLNVMPCVFPILFIKASTLMGSAGLSRGEVARHGWIYTAGVVATFAIIGLILLVLRAQGERLGWGFHLQSPTVVLLSSYVLFLVGLNLSGVFEIGTRLQGIGDGLTKKDGPLGSFFTGALAVVVAAPCIGPFLSAPMGAAILLPAVWGMAIFIVMAFGLAFPYLLLSLAPGLASRLPKPGGWMVIMRQLLAFPVYGAAAYFLWVLAAQTGSTGLASAMMGLLVLAVAAWVFGLSGESRRGAMLQIVAAVLAIAALLPLRSLTPASSARISVAGGSNHGAVAGAVDYDEQAIQQLTSEGAGVFVDFTAAWCVTCQFNKLTIFSSDKVAEAFATSGTTMMVADWTVRDEKITAALQRFNRSGVPLYVYYPPSSARQTDPILLPLPLTEAMVTRTILGAE